MKTAFEIFGGVVTGFIGGWFACGSLKLHVTNEISALRADVGGWLSSLGAKVNAPIAKVASANQSK